MQGARIWLPNLDGFFVSLGRLLESAQGQRSTASYDSAEFFSAAYEKMKNSLYLNSQDVLISDLNEIVSIINNLTRDFERIVKDFERNTPPL